MKRYPSILTAKAFTEVVRWIETAPYEEVFDVFLHRPGSCHYHQIDFLRRLKKEDLPLFINFDWDTDLYDAEDCLGRTPHYGKVWRYGDELNGLTVKQLYLNKLKGDSPCPPTSPTP